MKAGRRSAAVARGLAALVALAALLAGLPSALVVYGSTVLPGRLSLSPHGIWHALTSPDSGRLFMQALVVLGWAGWLVFAVSVLLEIPAQLRRRPTLRLPGLGWAQSAAATLVTSVTVMLAAPMAPMAAAAAPVPPHTVAAAFSIQTSAAVQSPAPATAVATAETTYYEVEPGDSLWGLAHKLLGRGEDYPRIAELNAGRVMNDGTAFEADGFLQPGWRLIVPVGAASAAAEPAPTAAHGPQPTTAEHDTPEDRHVVAPGESLSSIAAKDYGNPDLWPVIFEANKGAEQAGGHFTDPNLIYSGDKLTIPHLPSAPAPADQAPSTPPADGTPSTAPTPPSGTPTTAPTAQEQGSISSAPSATAGPTTAEASQSQAASSASASASAPADTPSQPELPEQIPAPTSASATAPDQAPAPATHRASSQDGEEETGLLLGGTLLTGLVLVGALGFRRRLQHKTRSRTGAIAMPQGRSAAFETSIRAGHDPDGAGIVAAALRLLAADAADRRSELPELAAVIYRPGADLELRLASAASLPEPFTSLDDTATCWSCPTAALNSAAGRGSVYPALTALGVDAEGASVLVDLEMLGALILAGPSGQTASVLRRLLLDLAGSGFAEHLSILLASDVPLVVGDVPGDRITVYPDVENALTDLEHAARAAVDLMDQARASTMRQLRPGGLLPEAEPTYILVTNLPMTDEQQRRLSAVLETSAPAAAVVAVEADVHLAVPGWTLPVDAGAVHVEPIGTAVTIPGLDDTTHELLTDLLTTASTTESAADPAWAEMLDSALAPAIPAPAAVPAPLGSGPADLAIGVQAWEPSSWPLYAVPVLDPLNDDDGDEKEGEPDAQASAEEPDGPDFSAPAASLPSGPRVLLLGPVEVTGRTGSDQRGRELRLTEMAAYMILHPGGGHTALASALWPDSDNDRHSELSRLRTWLGQDDAGQWYLPHRSYSLEGVTSDWNDFLAHVEAGNLGAALALVRDAPLLGTPPRRYGWAEWDRHMMIGKIADVAIRLSEAALAAGDHESARAAAVTGLQASPEDEGLARLAMRALLAARRRSEAADIAAAVITQCDDLGVDPEPETLEVIGQVRGTQNANAS